QCTEELNAAEAELEELTTQQTEAADFRKKIDSIRTTLRDAQRDAAQGLINKEFVDKYIDKIYATPEGTGTLHLQVKLSTGEKVDKTLQNLRSRTGHTFKKMIEAYESGMQ
ncbi:MAG: recombinase family protein, partial [Candidatus Faecousia sp.]|nr:recombinase family protein [Candidatus Faecousia sp.]